MAAVSVRIEPVVVRIEPVLVRMEPVGFEGRASAVWVGRESVSGTSAFNRFAAEALESIRRSRPWYPNHGGLRHPIPRAKRPPRSPSALPHRLSALSRTRPSQPTGRPRAEIEHDPDTPAPRLPSAPAETRPRRPRSTSPSSSSASRSARRSSPSTSGSSAKRQRSKVVWWTAGSVAAVLVVVAIVASFVLRAEAGCRVHRGRHRCDDRGRPDLREHRAARRGSRRLPAVAPGWWAAQSGVAELRHLLPAGAE